MLLAISSGQVGESAPWQWQIASVVIIAVIGLIGTVVSAVAASSAQHRAKTSEAKAIEAQAESAKRTDALEQQRLDHARISTLEARLTATEEKSRADWITFQAKHEADARMKRLMGDHIDTLEHHIYQELPPPPPARPPGI